MKHKYYLGKCDGGRGGHKYYEAYITWELEDGKFSMCAEVWNHIKMDIIRGGQCVDDVAAMFPNDKKARRMRAIWERWHLNDCRAGCEHQRAAKWEDKRIDSGGERGLFACHVRPDEHPEGLLTKPCPVCGYKYGTAWLKEALPPEVVAEIESWAIAD